MIVIKNKTSNKSNLKRWYHLLGIGEHEVMTKYEVVIKTQEEYNKLGKEWRIYYNMEKELQNFLCL